jgi:hypothetical protein
MILVLDIISTGHILFFSYFIQKFALTGLVVSRVAKRLEYLVQQILCLLTFDLGGTGTALL